MRTEAIEFQSLFSLNTSSLILLRLRYREARRVRTMKDIFPDHVETSKEEKPSKIISWLLRRNAFLWGGTTGAIIAIYKNFDMIKGFF